MDDFIDIEPEETTGAENSALVVKTDLPGEVVVIRGDVMAKVEQLRAKAGAMLVKDDESNTQAAMLLQEVTVLASDIEKARKKIKEPFLNAGREIDAAAKKATNPMDSAKGLLKGQMSDYAKQQAEAERKRQQEEAASCCTGDAGGGATSEGGDDDVFVDLDFDEPEAEPPAKVAKPALAGVSIRKRIYPIVEDFAKIPDALKVLNEQLVKQQYCQGWKDGDPLPEVDGLRFEVDIQPVASGKR